MFEEINRMTLVPLRENFLRFHVISLGPMWHWFSIWYGSWQYGETRNDLEVRMLAMARSFRDISRDPPILLSCRPTYLIRAQGNKHCEMFSINLILRMTVVLYYRMQSPIASSRSPSLFLGRRANRSWSGFPSLPLRRTGILPKEYRKAELLNGMVYNIICIINYL